jgi:hypothetical protein
MPCGLHGLKAGQRSPVRLESHGNDRMKPGERSVCRWRPEHAEAPHCYAVHAARRSPPKRFGHTCQAGGRGFESRRSRFYLQGFLRLSVPLNLPGWCSTRSVAFRSSPLGGPFPLRRSIAETSMGEASCSAISGGRALASGASCAGSRILLGARAERVVVELLASSSCGARHHVSLL